MVERTVKSSGRIFETKISQLDALLKEGGIVVPDNPDGVSILLKGSAGAGKSTLALLLAVKCARDGGPCLYCALERDGEMDIFFPPRQRWQLISVSQVRRRFAVPRLGLLLPKNASPVGVLDTAELLLDADLVGDLYVLTEQEPELVNQLLPVLVENG